MEELKSTEKNHTRRLVYLPERTKTIDVKWIFKVNMNPHGTISRNNARLLVRGFL